MNELSNKKPAELKQLLRDAKFSIANEFAEMVEVEAQIEILQATKDGHEQRINELRVELQAILGEMDRQKKG